MSKNKKKKLVIGIDDVARGAIAGSMMVCAFYHPKPHKLTTWGAKDSKKTTRKHREEFMTALELDGKAVVVCLDATAEFINFMSHSTADAIKTRALIDIMCSKLEVNYSDILLLVDGLNVINTIPNEIETKYIAQGDSVEPLISAASVYAKLEHDRLCDRISKEYPGWGFDQHKGYASEQHIKILLENGPTPIHRVRPTITTITTMFKNKVKSPPDWFLKYKEQ